MSTPTDLLTAVITKAVAETVRAEFTKLREELTPRTPQHDPEELVTTEQAAEILGISPNTLARYRSDEDPNGPRFRRQGRIVRYRRRDLNEWLKAS